MLLGRIPLIRPIPRGPITIVGVPVEANSLNGNDCTLTLPEGMQQNDVVYVFFCLASAAGGGTATPGWVQVGSNVDNTVRTQVLRKTMGYTPDRTVVLTGTANVADTTAAIGFALRGVDIVTPDDAAPTTATGTSTNPDSPAIVTMTNGAWVLSCFGSTVRDAAGTAPVGYSNAELTSSDDSSDCTGAGSTKECATAGSEDPASWTGINSGTWVSWSVAVRPAPV